jgi:hypothetical protein
MFPLAIVYSITSFILFFCLYILRKLVKIEGLVGYIGITLFSLIMFGAEFYTGWTDMFKAHIYLNLNQIGAFFLFFIGLRGLYKIYKE